MKTCFLLNYYVFYYFYKFRMLQDILYRQLIVTKQYIKSSLSWVFRQFFFFVWNYVCHKWFLGICSIGIIIKFANKKLINWGFNAPSAVFRNSMMPMLIIYSFMVAQHSIYFILTLANRQILDGFEETSFCELSSWSWPAFRRLSFFAFVHEAWMYRSSASRASVSQQSSVFSPNNMSLQTKVQCKLESLLKARVTRAFLCCIFTGEKVRKGKILHLLHFVPVFKHYHKCACHHHHHNSRGCLISSKD